MFELIPSIPLVTGMLVGLVGAAGAGFFVYGAALYLNAAADLEQQQRGRAAMRYAFAAVVVALVAFGAADLLVNPDAALPAPPALLDAQPLHIGR